MTNSCYHNCNHNNNNNFVSICCSCMLTQSFTHKSYKITTLTTTIATDSYKQLFVLIALLLTVLSVQPSTFAMAAPLNQPHQYQLTQPQLQQHNLTSNILFHHYHQHHYSSDHQQQHNNSYDDPSLPHSKIKLTEKLHKYDHHLVTTDLNVNRENNEDVGNNEEDRLYKRDISWHDLYNSIMQSQAINWYNPCGGYYKERTFIKKPAIKKELKRLRKTITTNYIDINITLTKINIDKMTEWNGEKYSFLPKLNTNSSISLRRWHRQIQIYVAAFEYLRRAQLYFDYVRDNKESVYAEELNKLMKNARNLLCNIEHAINNTTTRKTGPIIDSLFINRTRMEKILNFTTNIKYVSPLRWHQIETNDRNWSVDQLDLRFAKYHYYSFLRKLKKILGMHIKGPGPIYLGKKANKMQNQQQQKQRNKNKNRSEKPARIRHSRKKSNKYYNKKN